MFLVLFFVDLEPTVIDQIRTENIASLFTLNILLVAKKMLLIPSLVDIILLEKRLSICAWIASGS